MKIVDNIVYMGSGYIVSVTEFRGLYLMHDLQDPSFFFFYTRITSTVHGLEEPLASMSSTCSAITLRSDADTQYGFCLMGCGDPVLFLWGARVLGTRILVGP